jgi:hypothetical protein
MVNITAYGNIFSAVGCTLDYESVKAQLKVSDSPKGKEKIIEKAISDISHFDDCTNYLDGAAAIILADTIDGSKNPLTAKVRSNVLHGLAIQKNNKFIYQVLSLQKNNRSWHYSDAANTCSHFGKDCTHRGINPDPNRKGRRSFRQPDEYHRIDGKGNISREQLVTPSLEKLFQSIPDDNLIRDNHTFATLELNLKKMKTSSVEDKLRIISELTESMA